MSEKNKVNRRRTLSRILKGCFFLLILLIVALAAISTNFESLTDFASEQVALLTNSRLPDSSSRLAFSLTAPRDLIVTFDKQTKGADLRWSESSWRPSRPQNSRFGYVVSVFSPDNTPISSFSSIDPELAVKNLAGYLGQNLKFTVQAVGTILIGEHEYDFQSETGEFRWIVPAATPTPTFTPTATPTNTPTFTPTFTPTSTPTNTPTNTPTPTRLAKNDPQLSYLIPKPDNLSFVYNARADSGSISWGRSNWVPSKPLDSSNIKYEVRVIYPNRILGPYTVLGSKHTFSNLDTQPSQRLRFTVVAVGSIRIGQYEYEIRSEDAAYRWIRPTSTPTSTPTPTNTPTNTYTPTNTSTPTNTFTPTFTPSNTPTPTATFTPSNTPTPTATFTPSNTPTATFTPSITPTPTNTFTPSPTPIFDERAIRTAVNRYTSDIRILDVAFSGSNTTIEYDLRSWLFVPNETIAHEVIYKVICAIRRRQNIPYKLKFIGQGHFKTEVGRKFTSPSVEIHITSSTANRISCSTSTDYSDIRWRNVSSFYKSYPIPRGADIDYSP